MKNIAVFVEFKNNELTSYSQILIDFAKYWCSLFSPSKLFLYTFNDVDVVGVNVAKDTKAFAFIFATHNLFSCSSDISEIVVHLKQNDIGQILSNKSNLIDSFMSLISSELQMSVISNIKDIKNTGSQIEFDISTFSGKASLKKSIQTSEFIGIFPKSFQGLANASANENSTNASIEFEKIRVNCLPINRIENISKMDGIVPLNEAHIVVGAGRGMKDPGNWEIILALAKKINASTACSKPVSDLNWRPHHEHVGQTGVKIAPKLYIACGISGAIQHLAGVNGSRIIVVINNDPEASFFKHADYSIKGDLFDIVPRLTKLLNSI